MAFRSLSYLFVVSHIRRYQLRLCKVNLIIACNVSYVTVQFSHKRHFYETSAFPKKDKYKKLFLRCSFSPSLTTKTSVKICSFKQRDNSRGTGALWKECYGAELINARIFLEWWYEESHHKSEGWMWFLMFPFLIHRSYDVWFNGF